MLDPSELNHDCKVESKYENAIWICGYTVMEKYYRILGDIHFDLSDEDNYRYEMKCYMWIK